MLLIYLSKVFILKMNSDLDDLILLLSLNKISVKVDKPLREEGNYFLDLIQTETGYFETIMYQIDIEEIFERDEYFSAPVSAWCNRVYYLDITENSNGEDYFISIRYEDNVGFQIITDITDNIRLYRDAEQAFQALCTHLD